MTPEDWTIITYRANNVCSEGELEWPCLHVVWGEELAALCQTKHLLLLQHPRHGDVLQLLTSDTKEVKRLWSQLRHSGSRQKLKESLTGLWHTPISASYSLLLSSQQRRFHTRIPEEGVYFIIRWPPCQKNRLLQDSQARHWETPLSHLDVCGRQYLNTAEFYINTSTLIYH